jgi:hypothetical protein
MSNETHLTHLLSSLDEGRHVITKNHSVLTQIFPIPARNPCKNYKAYRYYDWRTSEGKKVTALSGDHVFVLLGYIGSRESPSHIIVWDTDTGRHIYQTTEWMRKW